MQSPVNIAECDVVAVPALRGEGRRAAFFRVVNWTTVGLVFWTCFVLVLTSLLPMAVAMRFGEWIVMVAYLVRQHLFSGLTELVMIGLGTALLPERLGPRTRGVAMALLLALGAGVSTIIRTAMSRYPPMSAHEHITWSAQVIILWTTLGLMAWGLTAAIRRQASARQRLGQQLAERTALNAAAAEARLTVLQAQIEPHFLFNTLAVVRRLCEQDPEQGRRMLDSLLRYVQAALPAMRRSATGLSQEFDLVRAYLNVLQHRMGERLRFRVDVADRLAGVSIPPLILPTLVENAIRHGLAPLPEGGTITVDAEEREGQVVIRVADDGAGFQAASGSGVGLANTRARLAALFGSSASLELRANEPRGVIAEVRLPLQGVAAAS
jgi:two-component sensor histidine kinase